MLALVVRYTFFARFAPRKVATVGVHGDVELSHSQGSSHHGLLSSLAGTENGHEAQGSVHSRVRRGGVDWVLYFLGKAEIPHVYENRLLVQLFGLQSHH